MLLGLLVYKVLNQPRLLALLELLAHETPNQSILSTQLGPVYKAPNQLIFLALLGLLAYEILNQPILLTQSGLPALFQQSLARIFVTLLIIALSKNLIILI